MGDFEMSINIPRGTSDGVVERMIEALRAYEADHPDALIDLYRQNSVSIRVRIIDPDFAGRSKIDRSKEAWKYLNALPDEIQSDLSTLILLTPEETKMSFSNLEFEDPTPSLL
jgi:stress-induced morphogen